MAGIDAHAHTARRERAHHIQHACQLFLFGNGSSARARRLPAYVDNERAFIDHALRMGKRCFHGRMLPPRPKRNRA